MTSSLPDHYINDLQSGSNIFGNLDFVGWVIIKKSYTWETLNNRNKPIIKLTQCVIISIIG